MYKITDEQLKEISTFLNEMPTKYWLPLLQYLNKLEVIEEPKVWEPKQK